MVILTRVHTAEVDDSRLHEDNTHQYPGFKEAVIVPRSVRDTGYWRNAYRDERRFKRRGLEPLHDSAKTRSMFQIYLATVPNNLHENTTVLANYISNSKEDERFAMYLNKYNDTIALP